MMPFSMNTAQFFSSIILTLLFLGPLTSTTVVVANDAPDPAPSSCVADFSGGYTDTASEGDVITINAEANGGVGYPSVKMEVTGPVGCSLTGTMHLWGAGGGGTRRWDSGGYRITGGGGGYSTGTYLFQPGTYYIMVGGGGEAGDQSPHNNNRYLAYSTGGGKTVFRSWNHWDYSGGGGLTGVFSDSISHSNSIIIAGGGGGGSGRVSYGGGGGGSTGRNAQGCCSLGGAGGTQTRGGRGGTRWANVDARSGGKLRGGNGNRRGGAGGGGYYGGGAGVQYGSDPWAGGGGSGYISPDLMDGLTLQGATGGNAASRTGYWETNVGRGGHRTRGGGGQITIVFSPPTQTSQTPTQSPTPPPTTEVASVQGDPHFESLSGKRFTWNGMCDVLLFKSEQEALLIIARTERVEAPGNLGYSFISSVGLLLGHDVLEIQNDGTVLVNGVFTPVDGELAISFAGHSLSKHLKGSKKRIVNYELDLGLEKNLEIRIGRTRMMAVTIPKDTADDSIGLLGNLSHGDALIGRDGDEHLTVDDHCEDWQVRSDEPKLFADKDRFPQYPSKCIYKSPDSVAKNALRGRRLMELEDISIDDARKACAGAPGSKLSFCIEDVIVTRDIDVAEDYL